MPFIRTHTNVEISDEKETVIKQKLGELISLFPGKSEYWLMLEVEGNKHLYFRGYKQYPAAMVEVTLFGEPDPDAAERFTSAVCSLLEKKLGIAKDHVYVRYLYTDEWGWNGENF